MQLQRHYYRVVLIVAHARLALDGKNTDDRAGDIADTDALADGVCCTEQFPACRLAYDAGGLAATIFGGGEIPAERQFPILRDQIIGGRADDAGGAVGAAGNHGRRAAIDRRHGAQAAHLITDCRDITIGEALGLCACPARSPLARTDEKRVGAKPREFVAHLGGGAVADGDHGDDRGNADDDAEHSEEGAQHVAADSAPGKLCRLKPHGLPPWPGFHR
ncbi:hypothetical protein D3C80_1038600 [compost metagenome]